MGHYVFSVYVDAPREHVFDLWVNVDRFREWAVGLTRITDVTGPADKAGTRYTEWFGRNKTQTEVLKAERPRLIETRFGNRFLAGTFRTVFEEDHGGTRVTQDFWTRGVIQGIVGRVFSTGSWKGSFRGELRTFARIAAHDAGHKAD